MSLDIANEAMRLFDDAKVDEANDFLCTQFEDDRLDYLIMRLNTIPEFRPRYDLTLTAAKLTRVGQFTGADHLQGDETVQLCLASLIYDAHPAFCNRFENFVVAEGWGQRFACRGGWGEHGRF